MNKKPAKENNGETKVKGRGRATLNITKQNMMNQRKKIK